MCDTIKRISAADYQDACPNHGAELVAEYTFGMGDADLYKHACGCCIVWECERPEADGAVFRSYGEAVGLAKLIVARESAADCSIQ